MYLVLCPPSTNIMYTMIPFLQPRHLCLSNFLSLRMDSYFITGEEFLLTKLLTVLSNCKSWKEHIEDAHISGSMSRLCV